MHKSIKILLVTILIASAIKSAVLADVYGGGYWEAIGLGNMTCEEFTVKTKDENYRELGAVWLSGFMSGVNFTSEDVYDITWGEDLYVLTDLVIKRCSENHNKLLSDIATEMVYQRYQDKNFSATKDVKN
ncbi:MAG: HdeA family protein [Gammaproteobacteria bacterium]|nr:HdeA family protein [Gammaproteobacteria bacterium]